MCILLLPRLISNTESLDLQQKQKTGMEFNLVCRFVGFESYHLMHKNSGI